MTDRVPTAGTPRIKALWLSCFTPCSPIISFQVRQTWPQAWSQKKSKYVIPMQNSALSLTNPLGIDYTSDCWEIASQRGFGIIALNCFPFTRTRLKKDADLKCMRSGQKSWRTRMFPPPLHKHVSIVLLVRNGYDDESLPQKAMAVKNAFLWSGPVHGAEKTSLAVEVISPRLERGNFSSSWSRKEGVFILMVTTSMCFLFLHFRIWMYF